MPSTIASSTPTDLCAEQQSAHEKALRELVKQITIGSFIDSEGHDAKMLFAYKQAQKLLGYENKSKGE